MKTKLHEALMTSIEALMQVPGTQLQYIELTLRQLLKDLKKAGITPPAELDELIEDAAVAHFESDAYMNGVAYGDEPKLQPYDDTQEAELSIEDRLTLLSYIVSSDFHYHGIVSTDIDREYVELEEALRKLHPHTPAPRPTDEEYELPF